MPKSRKIIGMKAQPGTRNKLRQMLDEAGYVITQPKLNGVHALWDSLSGLRTLSGKSITCLPNLAGHLRLNYPDDCLEGEIKRPGMTDSAIASFGRRSTPLQSEDSYRLHVFDLPPLGPGQASQGPLMNKRLDQLLDLKQTGRVPVVEHDIASNEEEITALLAVYLSAGYEGIIIRHPFKGWEPKQTPHLLKIKPGREDDYQILDVIPGGLVLDGDGEEFTVKAFASSPGPSASEAAFWALDESLIGKRALIRYQDTAGGLPTFGAVCVGLI